MKSTILIELLVITCLLTSCGEDTCNEKLGVTFHEISVDTVYMDTTNSLSIDLNLNSCTFLPDAYFEEYHLSQAIDDPFGNHWDNSWKLIDTIYFGRKVARLLIKPETLPKPNGVHRMSFHLKFIDRALFIDCSHPGGSDDYDLDLNFDLKNERDTFSVNNFSWEESLHKGGI